MSKNLGFLSKEWILNTGNKDKLKEYRKFFSEEKQILLSTDLDLKEIDADPIKVVVHKASQMKDNVLVEDTSLDVDGENVGINIKWLIGNLKYYAGKKASWTVLLAFKKDKKVYVFQGKINGTIVKRKGQSDFGFDSFFLPDGSEHTLAENKKNCNNARYLAVKSLFNNQPITIEEPIVDWDGPWQNND